MCLSIPSKVVKVDQENYRATVDTMGVQREAGLDLMEEGDVKVGDYVLIHIGFIMNKIDEEDARQRLTGASSQSPSPTSRSFPPGLDAARFNIGTPPGAPQSGDPVRQQQQQPQPQLMAVTCPQGVYGGMPLQLRSPTGTLVQVTVPQGMQPGSVFHVRM